MIQEQPRDRLGVPDLLRADQPERGVDGYPDGLQDLVLVAVGVRRVQAARDVDVHELGAEPRRRVELGDIRPRAGLEAGLLDALALRGGQRLLAFLDGPCWALVELLPGRGTA